MVYSLWLVATTNRNYPVVIIGKIIVDYNNSKEKGCLFLIRNTTKKAFVRKCLDLSRGRMVGFEAKECYKKIA